MEDRVAEVLAQRAAIGGGPAAGIAVSVALHAAIAGAAIYAALHHAPPEIANVLTIQLAPMSIPSAAPSVPAKAKTPVIKAPQPKIETPAVVAKPTALPSKNTAPPSPFGKSTKKAADVAPVPVAPPVTQQPGTPATPDIAPGTSAITGVEGGDFPYTVYLQNIQRLVGNHWYRTTVPPGTAATVYFVINRDGTIRDARVETPSGNSAFDRSVLRAVLESSPLPSLPFGYSGTWLGIRWTFK